MLKTYLKDQSGQFAVIGGLMITVLLLVVGAAIDYSNLSKEHSRLQALADAAVLAAARSGEDKHSKLEDIAIATVNSMMSDEDFPQTDLFIQEDNSIRVVVTRDQPLYIMSAFRGNTKRLSVIAEAPPKGGKKLNVALVLDTTDSMAGAKLNTLKVAANDLVDLLDSSDNASTENTLISVVPFSRYMKLPMASEFESWLNVEEDNYTCWDRLDLDNSGTCTASSEEGTDWVCDSPTYYEVCQTVSWYGCVASRAAPYHTQPDVGVTPFDGFAGGGNCHSELLPLSSDLADVSTHIDGLDVGEQTYIPSGLMWGWRTLTPDAPFIEANRADKDLRDNVLILMTDGENSRSYGGDKGNGFPGVMHWSDNASEANALTALACENIKLDGIKIYTVAFEVTDAATHTMLQNCASSPANYYNADNATNLLSAFNTIGTQLAAIRLSR